MVIGLHLKDVGKEQERIIDNKRVEGTIEEMLSGTLKFLERNMRTKVIIIDGKRVDKPEYPVNALMEAVANALIHRDYSFQTEGSYISVNMYNDRVEIISPGALYGANKLETIESGLKFETRNPTINERTWFTRT